MLPILALFPGELMPSPGLTFAFTLLAGLLAGAAVLAVGSAGESLGDDDGNRRAWLTATSLATAGWLLLTAVVARSGWLEDVRSMPPRLLLLVVPAFLATIVLAMGPLGRRLAGGLSIAALVGFQAFRVPLELMLWKLHGEGVLPVQMTFEGRNFDIVTGLLAVPVAWLAAKGRLPRAALLGWNWLGLMLLANIVVTAVLSTPYPFRAFANDPPNTLVFHSPWIWLPCFVVPSALFGHLLVLRAARRES